MAAKLRLFAYQREAQSLLTLSRKPVGWIFCPMCRPLFLRLGALVARFRFGLFLLLLVAHGHEDMAAVLEHAVAAPLGARVETLQRHAALDEDALDLELVDVGAVVLLWVGDRRLEHLLDDAGALLRAERQHIEGLLDRQSAD